MTYKKLYLYILGFQAFLSLINLSQILMLRDLAIWLGSYIGLVANLIQVKRLDLAVYISTTTLLTPFTIYCAYQIIGSLDTTSRTFLFVAPNDNQPLLKKILHTFFVFIFTIGFTWYLTDFGSASYLVNGSGATNALKKYELILAGGVNIWFGWALCYLTVLSAIWGFLIFLIHEWVKLFLADGRKSETSAT